MTTIAPQVTDFWVPVATIVPVFSLALVLEARRVSSSLTAREKFIRRSQSIVLVATAILLILIESWALSAMQLGGSDPGLVELTKFFIVVVMIGLSYGPIISIALRSNGELFIYVDRLIPGSTWRKSRKRLATYEARYAAHNEVANSLDVKELEMRKVIEERLLEAESRREVLRAEFDAALGDEARGLLETELRKSEEIIVSLLKQRKLAAKRQRMIAGLMRELVVLGKSIDKYRTRTQFGRILPKDERKVQRFLDSIATDRFDRRKHK